MANLRAGFVQQHGHHAPRVTSAGSRTDPCRVSGSDAVLAAEAVAKSANAQVISIGTLRAQAPDRALLQPHLHRAGGASGSGRARRPSATGSAGGPPDQISGVAVDDDNSSTLRDVGRAVLYPLRLGTALAIAPLRGGAWVVERYQLRDRITRLFVSDDGSYGFYPTAFVETGVGINAGMHMFHNDLFGHGEHLTLAAGFGGEFKQRYDVSFTSGALAADTRVGVRLSYRAWDRSNFFGIGNADQSALMSGPVSLDEAVHTRFAQNATHVELTTATPIAGPISLDLLGAYSHRRFNTNAQLDGFEPILNAYDEMSLVGFEHGADNFYGELALAIDARSVANRYISQAAPSTGWYGRVGAGSRRVSTTIRRTTSATAPISGATSICSTATACSSCAPTSKASRPRPTRFPFTDLPRLGGTELLRGFAHDRFRDRVAAVGSLEYDFPLQSWVGAYTFVDAGRVAHDLGSLDPSGVHVGWGGGLEFHTHDAFLFRVQAAHSIDGTFLRFALDPTYDTRGKARRK